MTSTSARAREANEHNRESELLSDESIQLLTFMLEADIYGVDISEIREVLEYCRVTPVPRTPDFMLGVINLRGQVVPVIDLRRQFDMVVSDITVDTCIIIVDVEIEGEATALGILADSVKEVIELDLGTIKPPPRIGSKLETRFISGIGEQDNAFIIILNLSRIFSDDEISGIRELTVEASSGDNSGGDPDDESLQH